ncbi:MAG: acetyl-CoA carboxylase biotin carboxyl carrier protein subunit [Bacteroidota bacterium]
MASYIIKSGQKEFVVEPSRETVTKGTINGKEYLADISAEGTSFSVILNHKHYQVELVKSDKENKNPVLRVNGTKYVLEVKDEYDALLAMLGMSGNAKAVKDLKAPMPGMVLDVLVNSGDKIAKDQPLVVLEAMKMENVLKSPADLVIKEIKVKKSNAVEKNQVLLLFE